MTSVLVVDDHPIVLQGCRRVPEDAGVALVTTASDLVAGYRSYRRHRPDVIVVDLSLKGQGLGGLELIRRINAHDRRARILVLSMHTDATIVARSLQAGACGYVVKDTAAEELVKAVQRAAAGLTYLSGELAMSVALSGAGARTDPLADLTTRELQVLALLAEGRTYDRIASELGISYKTVVNVSSQLKQKLRTRTLPELISTAVKLLAEPR